jgi:hypothetical protein
VATTSASVATGTGATSRPAAAQAATSAGVIALDAPAMCTSPAQSFSIPPALPETPTLTRTPGFASVKFPAASRR